MAGEGTGALDACAKKLLNTLTTDQLRKLLGPVQGTQDAFNNTTAQIQDITNRILGVNDKLSQLSQELSQLTNMADTLTAYLTTTLCDQISSSLDATNSSIASKAAEQAGLNQLLSKLNTDKTSAESTAATQQVVAAANSPMLSELRKLLPFG